MSAQRRLPERVRWAVACGCCCCVSHAMGKRQRPHAKAVLRGHTAPVTSLSFHKSADTPHILYSGDENGGVRAWDCRYEETVLLHSRPLALHESAVLTILQHESDVSTLLVQYKCGVVARVDVEYGVRLSDFDAWNVRDVQIVGGDVRFDGYEERAVLSNGFCCICHAGRAVWVGACADGDQVAVLYDDRGKVTLQKQLKIGSGVRKKGMVMSVCKCGQDIVTAYEDGSLATWDLRHCERPRNSVKVAPDAITSVTSSPFGRVAAAIGAFDKVVAVADLTQDKTEIVEQVDLNGGGGSQISWRRDGHTIATGGWDGVARIWDGRRKAGSLLRPICSLRWHDGSITSVDYSWDCDSLASGGRDCCIALWNAL